MRRVQVPWDHVEPGTPETGIPNLPSPLGEEAGAEIARLVKPGLDRLVAEGVHPCDECAYVKGALGNRCLATVASAIKCALEKTPFLCHMRGEPEPICVGFRAALSLSKGDCDGT